MISFLLFWTILYVLYQHLVNIQTHVHLPWVSYVIQAQSSIATTIIRSHDHVRLGSPSIVRSHSVLSFQGSESPNHTR